MLAWFDSQLVTDRCLAAEKEGDSLPLKYVSRQV